MNEKNGEKTENYRASSSEESISVSDDLRQKLSWKLGHGNVTENASNPDLEYLLEKSKTLTIEKSLEILTSCLKEHDDDPNFPYEDYEAIEALLSQNNMKYEENGTEWSTDVKMYAVLNEYFSPYPEVRAV
ncbi:hypothetical protein OXX59_005648, partial [Metschnikowia pulcherrima]